MTLPDFYAGFHSSLDAVLQRIPSEAMIWRFLKMYPQDESFPQLLQAAEKRDWNTAFRAAHTLKGVAGNLGLESLRAAASTLTEALRGGKPLENPALLDDVKREQEKTLSALSELE